MAFSKICSAFESHLKFLARSFHTENYLKVKVGYINETSQLYPFFLLFQTKQTLEENISGLWIWVIL